MTTIKIEDIERDPSSFLARVEAGEAFLITRREQAVAEVTPAPPCRSEPRPYGLAQGQFELPNDFNEPLPEVVLRLFEGA